MKEYISVNTKPQNIGGIKMVQSEHSLEKTANRIGGVLLICSLLGSLLFKAIEKMFQSPEVLLSQLQATIQFIVLMVGSFFLLRAPPKSLIICKSKMTNALGVKSKLLLTGLVTVAYEAIMYINMFATGYFKLESTMNRVNSSPIYSSWAIIAIVVLILAAYEEVFFRGILLYHLGPYGHFFAVVVTGLLFGIVHMILVGSRVFGGVLLGILFFLGGNILWPLLAHYLVNLSSGLPGGIASRFFPDATVDSINWATLIVCCLLTAIFFGMCLKDKGVGPLLRKWNLKHILAELKKDKNQYKTFFSAPLLIFFLMIRALGAFSRFLPMLTELMNKTP